MAKITLDGDIDLSVIKGKAIGVIGYGSQGHAHARNMKDSGLNVRVGLHEGSKSRAKAEEDGLEVLPVAELTKVSDVLMFCTPDVPMGAIYKKDVAPNLRAGQTLLFAHGLNIHFGLIEPPKDVNVGMVAPKGPGHRLRGEFEAGNGMPALIAVEQDATGDAEAIALGYAWGIGSGRAGILRTTFKEETETDLFGEQAVLCGGLSALIVAGFETLVEAGYQPEAAYFECLHETKLIVDLLYQGGLSYMRYSISETAEWGDYTAGPRIVGEETKAQMKALLTEIQDGTFVKKWIAENEAGLPEMNRFRAEGRRHQIEAVGKELRGLMPFLGAKEVPAGA